MLRMQRLLALRPRPALRPTVAMFASLAAGAGDFDHHEPGFARLNHGSFGACPMPVLLQQDAHRKAWLAQPDRFYFGGKLEEGLRKAVRSAMPQLTGGVSTDQVTEEQVCLMENATVATVAVAKRWAKAVQPGDVVLVLSCIYKASLYVLREHCEAAGATIHVLDVPFPGCGTHAEVTETVTRQLAALAEQCKRENKRLRYALLDHVASQPTMLLPVKDLVTACRKYGTDDMEVLVDGAQSIGSTDFNVLDLGCDWFLSNLHKWGFAPQTCCVLYAKTPELMKTSTHPITSWKWREGLVEESRWTGTLDYSAMLAVPAAMDYLTHWRHPETGETSRAFCHRRVCESAKMLAEAWGTELPHAEEMVSTQTMVQLPHKLQLDDKPGQPGAGVRATLRDRFGVEAAVANFGDAGNFLRLSYGVYNTEKDVERLRDAVLQLLSEQEQEQ